MSFDIITWPYCAGNITIIPKVMCEVKFIFKSRTKVECGGQCLATDDCEAFEFLEGKNKNYSCRYSVTHD